jgi:HK97 family phage major capsid protein|tara:strand:+ start:23772 stop:25043 length:1272 start_codon:yes stop_codon:yes gene_type:complete
MAKKEKTGKKKGFTKADLTALVQSTVEDTLASSTVIKEQVEAVMAPMLEQNTKWMENINLVTERQTDVLTTDPTKKGIGAARYVRALAFGRGDPDRAKHFVDQTIKSGQWDDALGTRVSKALEAGNMTAGGALLPDEFANEIIELLRSKSVVRAAGARVLPMNAGSLTIRKQTGSSNAAYVGEVTNISASQPTTGQIVMTSKKLAAIVPISNDLLTFAAGALADQFVRDDLVQELATREDQAFLRDDGNSETPKGMRYWAQAANLNATNGTSAANIESDLKDLLNDLETNDVRMISPAWFMNPRSKNHLLTLREASGGNLVFPTVGAGRLYDWPLMVSTNIPINLGGGANETEIYLVDMADAIIAEVGGIEIAVDASASYIESGSLVSAFSRDETLMRAITRHDFAMRHEQSVAVTTAVTWGA